MEGFVNVWPWLCSDIHVSVFYILNLPNVPVSSLCALFTDRTEVLWDGIGSQPAYLECFSMGGCLGAGSARGSHSVKLTVTGVLIRGAVFPGNVTADWCLSCVCFPDCLLLWRKDYQDRPFSLNSLMCLSWKDIICPHCVGVSTQIAACRTTCVSVRNDLIFKILFISAYLQSLLFPCLSVLHA